MMVQLDTKENTKNPPLIDKFDLDGEGEEDMFDVMDDTLSKKDDILNSIHCIESSKIGQKITKENYDEKISQLGNIVHPPSQSSWKDIDLSKIFFMCITTHELRKSNSTDLLAPFTRINDGKMFILGFNETSKIEALGLLTKIQSGGGSHVGSNKFFKQELTQIKFEPSKL